MVLNIFALQYKVLHNLLVDDVTSVPLGGDRKTQKGAKQRNNVWVRVNLNLTFYLNKIRHLCVLKELIQNALKLD